MPSDGQHAGALLYDFRRPNKFNRDHIRALHIANETFARQFTTVLSSTLRAVSQVSLRSVGQMTYDEYIREVPNPSYLAVLTLAPLPGTSLFHIPLPLVMAAVDRLLGGNGTGQVPERALTEIEASLMKGLLNRVLREMHYAWEALVRLEPVVRGHESNPQFAQVSGATDMVVTISFDVRIGDHSGQATIGIPFTSLQPVLDDITGNAMLPGTALKDPMAVERAVATRIEEAAVDVSVRFSDILLSSSEIVGLQAGDVLPLRHRADQPLIVSVAGVPCFSGTPGRRGQRLACLIVDPATEEAR